MRNVLLFLLLSLVPAQAQDVEGVWVLDGFGQKEVFTVTEAEASSVVTGEGFPAEGFQERAPVARRTSNLLVLGPREDRALPYEAVQFVEVDDQGALIARGSRDYGTPDAALTAPMAPAKYYFRQQRYDELQQLPTLPDPDLATLTALLQKAVTTSAGKTMGHGEMDRLFRHLLAAEGYNPFTSQEVFIKARLRFEDDPTVRKLLESLRTSTEE